MKQNIRKKEDYTKIEIKGAKFYVQRKQISGIVQNRRFYQNGLTHTNKIIDFFSLDLSGN